MSKRGDSSPLKRGELSRPNTCKASCETTRRPSTRETRGVSCAVAGFDRRLLVFRAANPYHV
jgi:hypothetical protein